MEIKNWIKIQGILCMFCQKSSAASFDFENLAYSLFFSGYISIERRDDVFFRRGWSTLSMKRAVGGANEIGDGFYLVRYLNCMDSFFYTASASLRSIRIIFYPIESFKMFSLIFSEGSPCLKSIRPALVQPPSEFVYRSARNLLCGSLDSKTRI